MARLRRRGATVTIYNCRISQSGPVGGDGAAIREQFATVVQHDEAVAQQAPALPGVIGDYPGG
jgi:hypothetical protein